MSPKRKNDSQLARIRDEANLTQDELANLSGVSIQAIRFIESGHTKRPIPNNATAIANVLSEKLGRIITVEKLFNSKKGKV